MFMMSLVISVSGIMSYLRWCNNKWHQHLPCFVCNNRKSRPSRHRSSAQRTWRNSFARRRWAVSLHLAPHVNHDITSPNQMQYMICSISWENLTFCQTCLPRLSFTTYIKLCRGFECSKNSIKQYETTWVVINKEIFGTALSFWSLALRLLPMLIKALA